MKFKLASILLVEDEPEVRFELKRFLQRYSRKVITASDGREGLKLFNTNRPDIIISDIKMPKMSGIDMAKEIKKISPEQMIIFTTAHNDNNYFLEAIEMQIDGYILKPVDLNLLNNKILNIVKNIQLEKEKKLYESILDDIAQMQDTMLAVYDTRGIAVFYNKKLLTFLGFKKLQNFLDRYKFLSHKFEIQEECYVPKINMERKWVEEIKQLDSDKRIVSMRGEHAQESKLFLVSLSEKTQSKNIIITFSEITSLVEKKRQYKHDAYTDKLTQINNRMKFNIEFEEAMQTSRATKGYLSVLLLDIDNFKYINDTYGHARGDSILKMFTEVILKHIRATDSFSRWGGEEFVLLLPNTVLKNAKEMAENLRSHLEEFDFGIDEKLTCSFGMSMRNETDTSESLFERVDKALYQAKSNGKNRVVFIK